MNEEFDFPDNDIDEKNDDIELETGNDNIEIKEPFDPNSINIKIIPFTVGQLIDKIEYEEIRVPEYQRKAGLWDLKKKSRFIESLILRLPIPLFYFDERELNLWWVVDGLQRVTTIREFVVEKKFKLKYLEFLKDLDDCDWTQLERNYQRNINQSQITINLIQKGTPEKVKHNIFRRINQGGIELSPQELRTALLWGHRTTLLKQMVSNKTEAGTAFLKATDYKVKTDRQEDLDFASRFVAFFLLGFEKYEPDMDNFLTDGTLQIPEDENSQNDIIEAFKSSMEMSFAIFNDDSFRKRTNKDDLRKPINKPLFEALSVGFARLDKHKKDKLLSNKEAFKSDLIQKQKNDEAFWRSLSTGTATRDSVKKRNEVILELLIKHTI